MSNRKSLKLRMFGGQTLSENVYDVIVFVITCVLLVVFAYPLIYVINCSFSDANAIWGNQVGLLPKNLTLVGYDLVFKNKDIWTGYANSLLYMTVGTAFCIFMNFLTAYPFSRMDFMPRNVIMFLYVVTMYFGGGLIPTYLVVKALGMVDTMWALIVPGCISTYNIILIRTYFRTNIPEELFEAASMDGCSHTRFFTQVVLPLSTPIIAVMVLFTAVGFWNSYWGAMIYLNTRSKFPLQLILREILIVVKQNFSQSAAAGGGATDVGRAQEMMMRNATMKYSVIVIASFPVMILYPFVQKYFVNGIMVGSIKS